MSFFKRKNNRTLVYNQFIFLMTQKKQDILNIALELFATQGYNNVTSKMIATKANVSEGLIFKHFNSKEELFTTIIKLAESKALEYLTPIIKEKDALKTIKLLIELPFHINNKQDFLFWKFEFKIKWESQYHNPDLVKPLYNKLLKCFKKLNYEDPEFETETLMNLFDGTCATIIRSGKPGNLSYKKFLLKKYKVS